MRMGLRLEAGAAMIAAIATGGFGVCRRSDQDARRHRERRGSRPRRARSPLRVAARRQLHTSSSSSTAWTRFSCRIDCATALRPVRRPRQRRDGDHDRCTTCWGVQRWAIFRFTRATGGSSWIGLRSSSPWSSSALTSGRRRPFFRPGDARCLPTGGKRARIWHWNGTRFIAGPWKQVTPGPLRSLLPVTAATSRRRPATSSAATATAASIPRAFVGCGIKSGLKPAAAAPTAPGASRATVTSSVRQAAQRPGAHLSGRARGRRRAVLADEPSRGCSATARRGAAVV